MSTFSSKTHTVTPKLQYSNKEKCQRTKRPKRNTCHLSVALIYTSIHRNVNLNTIWPCRGSQTDVNYWRNGWKRNGMFMRVTHFAFHIRKKRWICNSVWALQLRTLLCLNHAVWKPHAGPTFCKWGNVLIYLQLNSQTCSKGKTRYRFCFNTLW